jgi:hypothetical protein
LDLRRVDETQSGGRSQSARGCRVDQEDDLPALVELLLAALENRRLSGYGPACFQLGELIR